MAHEESHSKSDIKGSPDAHSVSPAHGLNGASPPPPPPMKPSTASILNENPQPDIHRTAQDSSPMPKPPRSIKEIAEFIQNGHAKKIVVLTGAGISTSAGIPDFRSPDTGIYANLAALDLPYPEAVFDIDFFRLNPAPFYVLARELYPGKFYPTQAHAFIALLEKKGLLSKLFTQNIDCLERQAGVSPEKIIEAHGSFATQRCIECKTDYPHDLMKQAVENGDPASCLVPQCGGLVKPDIVFFGEQLPHQFFMNTHVPGLADLVIVMGTSLSVYPFSSLPSLAKEGVPRLLFNMEAVGDLGSRPGDVIVLGDCDSGVKKLASALGWSNELEELWISVGGNTKQKEAQILEEARLNMSKDEGLEADIKQLATEIHDTMNLADRHTQRLNSFLEKPPDLDSKTTSPADVKPTPSSTTATSPLVPSEALRTVEKSTILGTSPTEPLITQPPSPSDEEYSINRYAVDRHAILDMTMPQNKPNFTKPSS